MINICIGGCNSIQKTSFHKDQPLFREPSSSVFFFLSSTGQACLTHVEIPMRGNSQVCTKTHTARIKSKINKSFIFAFLFLMREGGKPAFPFGD
jgi:hypothetical protein